MENLKSIINQWLDKFDKHWGALTLKKQHRYTLMLFAGYALLSIIVILKVCYDVGKSGGAMRIEHIENPVIRQNKSPASTPDSNSIILKNKMNER